MCMTTCKVTTLTRSLASPLCFQQPNLSCRMTEVTAAMMRPLIRNLYSERKPRYNARYAMLCKVMAAMAGEHIFVPEQHEHVAGRVGVRGINGEGRGAHVVEGRAEREDARASPKRRAEPGARATLLHYIMFLDP